MPDGAGWDATLEKSCSRVSRDSWFTVGIGMRHAILCIADSARHRKGASQAEGLRRTRDRKKRGRRKIKVEAGVGGEGEGGEGGMHVSCGKCRLSRNHPRHLAASLSFRVFCGGSFVCRDFCEAHASPRRRISPNCWQTETTLRARVDFRATRDPETSLAGRHFSPREFDGNGKGDRRAAVKLFSPGPPMDLNKSRVAGGCPDSKFPEACFAPWDRCPRTPFWSLSLSLFLFPFLSSWPLFPRGDESHREPDEHNGM